MRDWGEEQELEDMKRLGRFDRLECIPLPEKHTRWCNMSKQEKKAEIEGKSDSVKKSLLARGAREHDVSEDVWEALLVRFVVWLWIDAIDSV